MNDEFSRCRPSPAERRVMVGDSRGAESVHGSAIRGPLATLVVALICLEACGGVDRGGEAPDASQVVTSPAIAELPLPEPGALPERFSQRLVEAWERTQEMAESGYPDPRAAATAVGELGTLYFAYDLQSSAEDCYEVAAALEPDSAAWPYYLGLVRQQRVNPAGALEAFRHAAELDPDDQPIRYRLGEALLEIDDLAGARHAFGEALEAGGDVAVVHYGLGRIAAREGRTAEAVAEFELALKLQPEASVIHYPLARQYQRLGDHKSATLHLAAKGERRVAFADPLARQVALAKVTTAFDAVRNLVQTPDDLTESDILGFAIVRFGDIDGALEAFRRLLTDPQQPLAPLERSRAYYVLGALEARGNDHRAAIESLRLAVEADPEFAAARVQLASRLSRVGQMEDALRQLEIVLTADPAQPDALLRRAAVYSDAGRGEAALADLERLVELQPASAEGWLRIGSLEAAAGRPEKALAAFRRAQELPLEDSDRVLSHLRVAALLRQRSEFEAAAQEYRRALQVEPEALDAGSGLAAVYVQIGRLDEAIELYRGLQRGIPANAGLLAGEAAALIVAGRDAEARQRLEAGLEALPENRTLSQMLARHLAASRDLSVRDGRQAVALAESLSRSLPTAENQETLAMALAADGRFAEAARVQGQLLERLTDSGIATERLRGNLELYERGRPCCADSASGGATPNRR